MLCRRQHQHQIYRVFLAVCDSYEEFRTRCEAWTSNSLLVRSRKWALPINWGVEALVS